jgi:hypothetical protein
MFFKGKFMQLRTTKRPTQGKDKTSESAQALKTRGVLVKIAKAVVRYILLRPATWRFLQVHVPEAFAKVESWGKDVFSFFADLF